MAKERLYLFDTTMRDGALTTGVDFSLDDKRHIAAMLDRLGIDYVEGGYPAPIRSTRNSSSASRQPMPASAPSA